MNEMQVKGSRASIEPHQSIPHISMVNRRRARRWHPDGIASWSLSDWAVALAGECGELCNVVKKLNRIRDGITGNKESAEQLQKALADEIADVYLYLDLFAHRAGVNLENVIRDKFNATSERIGFPERI
jgi:NTP pyrophosphatase (non-canonical NTP hydrolase)